MTASSDIAPLEMNLREAPRPSLSEQAIIAAAVELIDADGVDSFSMRGLARQLGFDGMALYRYVDNREALLDAVVGALALEIQAESAVGSDAHWQDMLKARVTALRSVGKRHRGVFSLLATRPGRHPAARAISEESVKTLMLAGFEINSAIMAWRTLISFAFGFVIRELADNLFVVTTGSIDAEFAWGMDATLRGVEATLQASVGPR